MVLPGFLLQHKPVGATSFDLVRALQTEVSASGRRLPSCHGGVLDPFAEGLLILLVGKATHLMDLLHPLPKTYLATIRWGTETDTGDPLGRVVATGLPEGASRTDLDRTLRSFLGWRDQVPPATSNKRVDGERAYVRAHRGEDVVLPPSRVYLHAANVVGDDVPGSTVVELICRGGFYVRSLVRDLGRALGIPAHLERLHRTAIGPWRDPPPGARIPVTGPALLPWCRSRQLSDPEVGLLRQSGTIDRGEVAAPSWTPSGGYPLSEALVLGIHRGKLASLLTDRDGLLVLQQELRGGL